MNDCAVCGRSFPSMTSRANHERKKHPSFVPTSELARTRRNHSLREWKRRQGAAWNWIMAANQAAKRYGHSPLSARTALPSGPCAYCGGVAGGWDHVHPLSRGGSHDVTNIVPSCLRCNQRKNAGTVESLRTPSEIVLLCGWCWTPVVRKRAELYRIKYAVCCSDHQGRLRRWNAYRETAA